MVGATTPAAEDWTYAVQPGDTLWGITERYLKGMSYVPRLQALNGIANPRALPPGRELRIPFAWTRLSPVPVQVRAVTGEVTVQRSGAGPTRPVAANETLQAGDVLRTGPDGNVTLDYFDGYRLRLETGSELVLRAFDAYTGTAIFRGELLLPRGRIESRSPPRHDPASGIRVNTPGGVTSTRGTEFRVSAEPDIASARTEVLDGGVDVAGAGTTVAVETGYGTIARSGSPPTEPTPLLQAPDLSPLLVRQRRVPVAIALAPLARARAYRVQIATDATFDSIVFDAVSRTPELRGPDLPDGRYALRARGIDVQGLEGRDAVGTFEVDARPFPPALLEPKDRSVVAEPRPTLAWTLHATPARYRLQVAEDAAFEHVLFEVQDWREASWTPDRSLPPGRYFWRLAASDERDGDGPFGTASAFRRPPDPPVLTTPPQPRTEERTVTLAWSAAAGAAHYDIQVSRAPDFATLVHEARGDTPVATIPKPEPGLYYVRVRAIDADGTPGPFTDAQTFRCAPPPPAVTGEATPDALVVRWRTGTSGWRYDVQVARDEAFATLLDTRRTADGFVDIPRSEPGVFRVRVRTVDVDGFEGPFGPVLLLRRPPAPPALSGEFVDGALVLRWPVDVPGLRYEIQVAKNEDFAQIVESARTSAPPIPLRVPPGRYHVRIRSFDAEGLEGPFGPPVAIRAPLPAPLLQWAEMRGGRLTIGWAPGAAQQRHRIQLARDTAFTDIVWDARADGSQAGTTLPPRGRYFARVAAIDADGMPGAFSPPRTFTVPRSPILFWARIDLREAKRP